MNKKKIISAVLTLTMAIALCVGMNTSTASARTGYSLSPNDWYYWLSPEEKARVDWELTDLERIEIIQAAKEPTEIYISEREEVTGLSNWFMQALVKNPLVSVDMTYKYEGKVYHVIIPAGEAVDDHTEYYGPLYLYGKWGVSCTE